MKKVAKLEVHDKCRQKTNLDGLLVLTTFDGNIKKMITDIKYHYYFHMSETLAIFLANFVYHSKVLESIHPRVSLPIPLHSAKRRERGFNQSELLANTLAKTLKIPTTNKVLWKKRSTQSQAGLKRDDRLKNLSDSFEVTIKLKKTDTVLLVDDVVTTGSTLSVAAKALKQAGAGKVYGIALAHGS
jgi:ComF family protein